MPPKSSLVWKHFNKQDKETVMCKLCNRYLKFHSSTSNMKSHLKSRHPYALDDLVEYDSDAQEVDLLQEGDATPSTSAMAGDSSHRSHFGGSREEKQVLNYQKLVVPMSMRSVYWKCFGFPASADGEILTRVKIVCLLCKNVITYNRNTSNLRMHLQNKHSDELDQLELQQPPAKPRVTSTPKDRYKKKKEIGNIYSTNVDGSIVFKNDILHSSSINMSASEDYHATFHIGHDSDNHNSKEVGSRSANKSESNSAAGKSHVQLVVPYGEPACTIESLHPFMIPIESKSVCDAIAEFVILDLQLPDVVEGRGFQRLVATLKSPCEIPSKSKLVDEVIPRVYDNLRENVNEALQGVKSDVALTVEEWDSASGETYVTFSACYQLEKDDNLFIKVLSTIHCYTSVDVNYWNMIFENMLEEWNLKIEKIKAVVCGSCRPELIDAMVNKGLIVLPCLIQTLQEVCTRVCFEQEDVREILCKCRALIYVIYKNNSALAALRIQDHLMTLEETPLMSDYPRVWLSTYVMLEGLLARRQVVSSILDNVEPGTYDRDQVTISDLDWSLIEDVLSVLEPFKVTMMTLSEEKSPLVSLLKPLLWQLLGSHLKAKPDENMNAQVFKAALKSLLSEKYSEPAVSQLLLSATTLDPRFKSLPNTGDESKKCLEGPIRDTLVNIIEENPEEIKPLDDPAPEKKKPKLLGMVMLLGDMCPATPSSSNSIMTPEDRARLEIVQYQSEGTAPLDQCPFAWWSRTATKCPHLARLASQFTCIPASAVPPARIPLDMQVSYDIKRSNLSPEVVDRLVFLNSNFSV